MFDFKEKYCRWNSIAPVIFLPFCIFILNVETALSEVRVDEGLADEKSTKFIRQNELFIGGGARRKGNLFHYLTEFNPGRQDVSFIRPKGVKAIFSLVTGTKGSVIQSRISVKSRDLNSLGNADFYLVNPNGIRLGEDSSFDLKGNLFISSAERIYFDGGLLEIQSQSPAPLLSSDPRAFAFRANNSGQIKIQSTLQAPPRKDISILGGNITIQGGRLNASGGKIVLASVRDRGQINFNASAQPEHSNLSSASKRGNIVLRRGAIIRMENNSVSPKGAAVELIGENISLREKSGISTLNRLPGASLDIAIDSSGVLFLSDESSIGTSHEGIFGRGSDDGIRSGDIRIIGDSLRVVGEFIPPSPDSPPMTIPSSIGSINNFLDLPSNGDIDIYLTKGARLVTGNIVTDGSITIDITDGNLVLKNFSGIQQNGLTPSLGEIDINVSELLRVGDHVFGLPSSIRNDNRVSIQASNIEILGSANLLSTSFADEQSGDIVAIASRSVIVDGGTLAASKEFSTSGDAGSIFILAPELQVKNGGSIRVASQDRQAGQLTISASNVLLDDGMLTTRSVQNEFGSANIVLNVTDELRLRNNSLINAGAIGDTIGGNVLILNTPQLIAEGSNNDIIAIAPIGQGGNLIANVQDQINFVKQIVADFEQLRGNESNDISVAGERPGFVDVDTLTELNQGLIELPKTVIDPDTLIAQNPCSRNLESEYTLSGRGGLPVGVKQPLNNDQSQVGFIAPTTTSTAESSQIIPLGIRQSTALNKTAKLPAQGWVYDQSGKIQLVAYQNQVNSETIRKPRSPQSCSS